jgi:hypothetical protein
VALKLPSTQECALDHDHRQGLLLDPAEVAPCEHSTTQGLQLAPRQLFLPPAHIGRLVRRTVTTPPIVITLVLLLVIIVAFHALPVVERATDKRPKRSSSSSSDIFTAAYCGSRVYAPPTKKQLTHILRAVFIDGPQHQPTG